MIPEAAVEAAAWVVIAGQKHGHEAATIARAALEAAAPHMLAQGWDEGHEEGWLNHESGLTEPEGRKRNTYRSPRG